MFWQDIVIAVANVLFNIALVPQVYHGFKKRKKTVVFHTSLLTVLALYAMAFSFFTLGLYFAFAMVTLTGTLWLVILIQGLVYR